MDLQFITNLKKNKQTNKQNCELRIVVKIYSVLPRIEPQFPPHPTADLRCFRFHSGHLHSEPISFQVGHHCPNHSRLFERLIRSRFPRLCSIHVWILQGQKLSNQAFEQPCLRWQRRNLSVDQGACYEPQGKDPFVRRLVSSWLRFCLLE